MYFFIFLDLDQPCPTQITLRANIYECTKHWAPTHLNKKIFSLAHTRAQMRYVHIFSLLVIFIFGLGFRDMTVFPNLAVFSNGYNFRLISHKNINTPSQETFLLAQPDKHKKFPVRPTASA